MSIHEAALWSAYLDTDYVVQADGGEIVVRVGARTPDLDLLLARCEARRWCFVTAWNPDSEPFDDAVNAARNDRLRAELERASRPFFEGEGRGQSGDWPPERSFLVFDVDLEEATLLGRSHGQIAVVYGEQGEAARLVDCRERADERA